MSSKMSTIEDQIKHFNKVMDIIFNDGKFVHVQSLYNQLLTFVLNQHSSVKLKTVEILSQKSVDLLELHSCYTNYEMYYFIVPFLQIYELLQNMQKNDQFLDKYNFTKGSDEANRLKQYFTDIIEQLEEYISPNYTKKLLSVPSPNASPINEQDDTFDIVL